MRQARRCGARIQAVFHAIAVAVGATAQRDHPGQRRTQVIHVRYAVVVGILQRATAEGQDSLAVRALIVAVGDAVLVGIGAALRAARSRHIRAAVPGVHQPIAVAVLLTQPVAQVQTAQPEPVVACGIARKTDPIQEVGKSGVQAQLAAQQPIAAQVEVQTPAEQYPEIGPPAAAAWPVLRDAGLQIGGFRVRIVEGRAGFGRRSRSADEQVGQQQVTKHIDHRHLLVPVERIAHGVHPAETAFAKNIPLRL